MLPDNKNPQIMGVLNVTPDSFSDGGALTSDSGHLKQDKLVDVAAGMVAEGVDWLDVGGESTRPGAAPVSLEEEVSRVMPALEAIKARFDVNVSVDTSAPELMVQAVEAGCDMVNDVRALSRPGALEAVARLDVPVCLMHIQGEPDNMQANPAYDSLLESVLGFLQQRVSDAIAAGIRKQNIVLDPGFGFGKTFEHNIALMRNLEQVAALGYPMLVGVSRKSMIGHATGREVYERDPATLAANLLAVQRGASILRVHNVAYTRDMLDIWRTFS